LIAGVKAGAFDDNEDIAFSFLNDAGAHEMSRSVVLKTMGLGYSSKNWILLDN
jgi:hypothetical protein